MKSKNDFRTTDEYEDYLFAYFIGQALPGVSAIETTNETIVSIAAGIAKEVIAELKNETDLL